MGGRISSLFIEPIFGVAIVTLSIFAIIRQNQKNSEHARYFAIAAVVLLILFIILNIVLTVMGG